MRQFGLLLAAVLLSASSAQAGLQFEFDYRFDRNGYFDDPARREALEAAGRYVNKYVDELAAVIPEGNNGWDSFFAPPDTGVDIFWSDVPVAEDTMLILAGARPFTDFLAISTGIGPVGRGDDEWKDIVSYRGQDGAAEKTDFGPLGGKIAFNNDFDQFQWHFGLSTEGLEPQEFDFITVAMHELLHIMGIGVAPSFAAQVDARSRFTGPEATAVSSSTNPNLQLDAEEFHFAAGTKSVWNGELQEALLAPGIFPGVRAYPTLLDRAVLRDIGWEEALVGDANRDRTFNSTDLVEVLHAGRYETGEFAGWSEGDWNDNGLFESSDLVAALQTGTYDRGGPAAVPGVPEPSAASLAAIAASGIWALCRRRRRPLPRSATRHRSRPVDAMKTVGRQATSHYGLDSISSISSLPMR